MPAAPAAAPVFDWTDPLLVEEQLSEDERMVRDSARAYCQEKLLPRVLDANRHEHFDREIMNEMGALGLSRLDHRRLWLRRRQLRLLRPDRARGRARRQRLPLGDERAVEPGDVPDLRVRHRSAAAEVSAEARDRRVGRLLRPDRARSRLRSRRHGDARAARSTGGYRLNGAKMWITNSPIADVFVVWAKTDDGVIRGFILEKGMAGPQRPEDRGQVQPARLGHRRDRDGRRVRARREPAARASRGLRGPFSCLNNARYGIAWGALGAAEFCWHAARNYTLERTPVRPAARRQPADPEEARRHADRDRARPATPACASGG